MTEQLTATIQLSQLLAGLAVVPTELDRNISGIQTDSRQVQSGDLFCAVQGSRQHGLDFLSAVQAAAAAAVVWEPPYPENPVSSLPLFAITDLSQHLGLLTDRFYHSPAQSLRLIGVTGTDGKTSCAYYIAQALQQIKGCCGIAGTLGAGLSNEVLQNTGLTTADVVTVRRWLAAVRDAGAHYAVMEVSSHALDQGRVQGLPYQVAVLTNLGRDHLDYHPDLNHYAAAKRRLFIDYQPRHAVLNLDDEFGQSLAAELDDQVIGYSSKAHPQARISAQNISLTPQGMQIELSSDWGKGILASNLLGRFNASNLMAALGALLALDIPWQDALHSLSQVHNAPGRMERINVSNSHKHPVVVVDYAHTPQALLHALQALREHGGRRLWCVFGCGGDRDPGKRPLMGAIAQKWADQVIVTDDNPRTELADEIVQQILAGMLSQQGVMAIAGREHAIHYALASAQADDIVLIAGKGHEDYQIIGDQRLPFDDRAIAQVYLQERAA